MSPARSASSWAARCRRGWPRACLLAAILAGCGGSPAGSNDRLEPDTELVVGVAGAAADGSRLTFAIDVDTGAAPLVVRAASPVGQTGTRWDFGDGSGPRQGDGAHVYTQAGVFTVTVQGANVKDPAASAAHRVVVTPCTLAIKGPALCRVGQGLSLQLPAGTTWPCTWSAQDGVIFGADSSASYTAPAAPGTDRISATLNIEGTRFRVDADVRVFRQFIILKADDIGVATVRWGRYLNWLRSRGVASTAGIIWSQLRQADPAWQQFLLSLQAEGLCEFFHHGYDHSTGANLDGTAPGTTQWEFRGTSYEFQRQHLDAGLVVADSLGFVVRTFGAPFNKADASTVRALDEQPAIRTVLFEPPGGNRLHLRRTVDLENGTGKSDLAYFVPQYRAHEADEYLVLQIHPNATDDASFTQLQQAIDLLISEQRTFVTAEDYRRLNASRLVPAPRRSSDEPAAARVTP